MKYLKIFFKQPFLMKLLIVEAAFFLLVTRILIIGTPYRFWRRLLGSKVREADVSIPGVDVKTVRKVSFWINRIAPRLPLNCSCLAQAVTGRIMLKRRGIKSSLYLGLGNDGKLMGHAWLKVNDIPVTGGKDNSSLALVGIFE